MRGQQWRHAGILRSRKSPERWTHTRSNIKRAIIFAGEFRIFNIFPLETEKTQVRRGKKHNRETKKHRRETRRKCLKLRQPHIHCELRVCMESCLYCSDFYVCSGNRTKRIRQRRNNKMQKLSYLLTIIRLAFGAASSEMKNFLQRFWEIRVCSADAFTATHLNSANIV